ncbi:MAG TPA: NB-ARC domain-containing protein [Pseudolysinimonas sp.]|jgi:tetratricopeptide (TPR) repeat protein
MDFRDLILRLESDSSVVWPSDALSAAESRLERDRGSSAGALHSLLVAYLDFADAYQIVLANKSLLQESTASGLAAVKPYLEGLIAVRNRVAHSRPMEIDDLAACLDVAHALAKADKDAWPITRDTLTRLQKNPEFVLGLSIQLPSDPDNRALNNLPAPDFDETGFMGRGNEIKRIKKAILGPYPVVSILGDGGLGKTAIALKVAYDLLDDDTAGFEAIVWVSAKSTRLTDNEIENISGAIQDSIGLFDEAARTLGSTDRNDPMVELLDYMASFKILLVLDNLETVNDEKLREFLLELPVGSKVLITSRIGLGIENPVKLGPLSDEESKRLLKALASIRAVTVLRNLDEGALDRFIRKLQGHPLYIKWFVGGVQAGKRPSDLVNDNSLLLDFCMSNVYGRLGKMARGVLQSMQVLPGVRSQGELAFLNDLKAAPIQAALLDLMTTNFVSMKRIGEDDLEAGYETSEFAAQYLSIHHSADPQFRATIAERVNQLSNLALRLRKGGGSGKYDPRTIDIRGPFDVPSARLLVDAQRDLKNGKVEAALDLCREAQTLSPNYPEAWRMEGVVHERRQDQISALHSYEQAYELASHSPLMGYHFGVHLISSAGGIERGLLVLQTAAKVDKNPQILLAIARTQFEASDYLAATVICDDLLKLPLSDSLVRMTVKLGLRSAVFGAEQLRWNGDLSGAVQLLESSTQLANSASVQNIEIDAADWLVRLRTIAEELSGELEGDPFLAPQCHDIAGRLLDRARVIDPDALSRRTGQVKMVEPSKHFSFANSDGSDYFFHHNDLVNKEDWDFVAPDVLIAFAPERVSQGLRARQVRVL